MHVWMGRKYRDCVACVEIVTPGADVDTCADADALLPDTGALDRGCHVVECHYGGMVEARLAD